MTVTPEPPAQPAPSANDLLTTGQADTSAPGPLFSPEAVEEAVRAGVAAADLGGWDRVERAVLAALAAPGVRREVEARDRRMRSAEARWDASQQSFNEQTAECARLAAALEAAERGGEEARDSAAYWMEEAVRLRRAVVNIIEAGNSWRKTADGNRRCRERVDVLARAALSGTEEREGATEPASGLQVGGGEATGVEQR